MTQATQILKRLDRIESILAEQHTTPLDLKEAAAYLGLSTSYLYKLTASGSIAHFKPAGKKVYFLKEDLDAYLLRGRVTPLDEVDEMAAEYVAAAA